VTEQQQQHTSNKLTNKQNPYGNPTTRYCETFAGRKEGNAGKVHISGWGDF
jgi:hypothetical protein